VSGAQPLDRRTEAARDPARDPGPAPPGAPPLVLGTAGHIDHGKTALVRALTGQDLDRLPEEKARGITIELGFAPLALADDLAVAIVDVPGHERFVRTMVAGASGLDLVMLVVAADEGVMPQTREHLAICELLGVERGLVVLTKSDLVDEEMLELATEDVRDALAAGPLADAPIVAASAQTGQGLDAVRATLEALVRTAPARRDDRRPARLAIDRVFTKHGFGTVATGTWTGRPLAVGAAVVLEPGARKARIRGLERHGEEVATSLAGARIAVNLQDRAGDEIHRGDVLTEPAALLPTTVFDATLRWLSRETPLAEPTSVELLCGTTERRARVAPIGEKPVEPGGTGFARIHVEGPPLALLPGDRFVIRGFARDAGVGATLGGGRVLDVAPPHRRRRDPALRAELERIARGDETAGLLARIERSALSGADLEGLRRETGLDGEAIDSILARLVEAGAIECFDARLCMSREAADRLRSALLETLDAFHEGDPLQPGMSRAALMAGLPGNVPTAARAALVARLAETGAVAIDGEVVSRTGFTARLDDEERGIADRLARRFAEAGLEAPALRTIADETGLDATRLRALAHYLERQGALIAAPDDLFFDRAAVLELVGRVLAHFDAHDALDTQALKALIGTSRRTAMPLMALLDDLQVTRRDGSVRRLLSRTPRW